MLLPIFLHVTQLYSLGNFSYVFFHILFRTCSSVNISCLMKFSFYFNLLFFLYYVLSKFRQYCFYMSGFKNISMAAVQMKYLGEHFDYLFTYYTHNCRLWIWEQVLIIYNSLVWTVSLFLIIIILLGWWSYN